MRARPSFWIGLVSFALATQANAGSHLWRFSEFYSSEDGQIQFIEMQEIGGSQNETAIQGHWYATNGFNQDHALLLGSALPFGTANKKFLVGTESYAALPGVPAPDYILPDWPGGIVDPLGDTVVWWFYQTLEIPPDTLPTDGTTSLHLIDPAVPAAGFVIGPNSPTNFAGETGTISPPVQLPATSGWGLVAGGLVIALGVWRVARLRRRSIFTPRA